MWLFKTIISLKSYIEKMSSYCLKCKKSTESINPRVSETGNGKSMILLKCEKCGSKKSRFIRKEKEKGLFSSLGLKTPIGKIPLLGDILFSIADMTEIINKFFLTGDEFMPEMHLKQPKFTYSA